MRELFVYYRVSPEHEAQAGAAVRAMHSALRAQHPQLIARLLRRADGHDRSQTWMEVYATAPGQAPEGVDAMLQSAIDTAAGPLTPWLDGPRHTEAFIACAL